MSGSGDALSTCGACERDDALDAHENPAALSAINYRIATYGRFLERMVGVISRQVLPPEEEEGAGADEPSGECSLATLTTRATDDPAIALMDAWACVLDVLTFYQERIANEGFLRTATERRSVLELARAIGYELAPGVAASTRLSFTLLDTDKSPREVVLPSGLQVQSVPGPGEQPQIFETVEEVLARPEWNAMLPVQRQPQRLLADTDELYVTGLSTGLRLGDQLLFVSAERQATTSGGSDLRRVVELELDKANGISWLRLDRELTASVVPGSSLPPRVFAFSRRANVFGHSAPDPRMFSTEMKTALASVLTADKMEWLNFTVVAESSDVVHLAGEIDGIVPGSWLVLEHGAGAAAYAVTSVQVSGRVDFALSLRTTRLTLDTGAGLAGFNPRSVSAYAASRELKLATQPIDGALEGPELVLDRVLPLLEPGRALFVTGPLIDSAEGAADSVELSIVREAVIAARFGSQRTVLRLEAPLDQRYDRTRTTVLGNVARSTHGKTIGREVLGSGDGTRPFQSFALRQHPLTYCSSPTAGTQTTLVVRAGGVEWSAVSSTFQLTPEARVYVPRIDDDGVTTVTFGDGLHGARLPTGTENVTAHYRVGLGQAGAVPAQRLSVLKTRPQGVKAVTNPLAATGAEDAEVLGAARSNAPVTVLTLDRLVSARDYEDYARAYPGIGKAQSVRLWDGRRWWLHLTLATSEGARLLRTNDLYRSLTADIHARRDAVQRVIFDTFSDRRFTLRGTVRVDAAYVAADVIAQITRALGAAFSFGSRAFGQPVTGAEILKLAHGVDGVVALDLDALDATDGSISLTPSSSPAAWVLPAFAARWTRSGFERAELLLLDDAVDAVALEEATP